MLVVDVSLSMEATDVKPTRIKAAQAAARSFVEGITPGVNLGVVAFAGTASVLVSPTNDRQPALSAIDTLELAESTATGEAIFAALQAIDNFSAAIGGAQGPPPALSVLMADGRTNRAHRRPLRPLRPARRLHRGQHRTSLLIGQRLP
jgi:Ca-activated chloride channel homolog